MSDALFRWLFDPSGLTPHGFCLLWDPGLLWLHAVSDLAIGLAFFAIPLALVVIIRKRPDLVLRPVYGLFAAFILLCGAGHWLDLLTLWVPAYGAEGLVKAATAVTSIATVIVTWHLIPKALTLPSRAQLRRIRSDLAAGKRAQRRLATLAATAANARDELVLELSQKAAVQDALRDSEERFRLLLHSNVTEALYLLDANGNIETWNASAERIMGYLPAEIIGKNFSMFFSSEDIASGEPSRVLDNATDNGRLIKETWRVRKDGSRFLAHIAIDAIRRTDGSLRGFVKMTRDITEQRNEETHRSQLARDLANARDQAEQANQAKSRFLAGVTHELRTPLHGILGYAELLSLEGDLTPVQSQRLEVMMTSGHHLLEMINSVLDMSQIDADELELQVVDTDLANLVGVCLDVVRPAAETKGLTLGAPPIAPIRVAVDPVRVRQVLINLLANAIKFTPTGWVDVRLHALEDAPFIRLEVIDTGPGIRAQHRDKLFQAFERLNANAVSGIEGTGLGLAIAARLVNLMDGRIGYTDNPAGGSIFWLELPMRDATATAVEAPERWLPAAARGLRVLVADDEPLNRSIAAGFLTRAGHEVLCVDNGVAAIEAAACKDFDIILMDVRMPGMNGMEATRQIRALPAPRGAVRVVAVTAQAFRQQIEMCRRAGMDGHVSKPFTQAGLLAALTDTEDAPRGPAHNELRPGKHLMDSEPEHPVLDYATFRDATDCLTAGEVAEQMQILIARCEALLSRLRDDEMLKSARELVDDAHRLAGGSGTFGFMSVCAAAREFELAADTDVAHVATFASALAIAIEASIPTIRQECPSPASPAGSVASIA